MLVSFDALAQQFAGYTDVKGKIRREISRGSPSTGHPTSRSTMLCPFTRSFPRRFTAPILRRRSARARPSATKTPSALFCTATFPLPCTRSAWRSKWRGIFLSDRLARKSAVRQAVFAFARVFGEGAQRTAVRRSAHRRSRLLCAAKGRHLTARAALPRHQSEITRKVHGGKVS